MRHPKAVLDPEQLPEEPDHDPDQDPEDEPVQALAQSPSPSMGSSGERDWEYRTEVLTIAEVADGTTLVGKLTEAAAENWNLVEVIDAGDRRVVLLRRQRKAPRERRAVGFAPPGRG